jgi:hypothetical protein
MVGQEKQTKNKARTEVVWRGIWRGKPAGRGMQRDALAPAVGQPLAEIEARVGTLPAKTKFCKRLGQEISSSHGSDRCNS